MKSRVQHVGFVELSLKSRWRGGAFLLAMGLATFLFAGEILRIAIAARLGRGLDPRKVRWALALDPTNATIHRQLGLLYCYSPAELSPPDGIRYLRRAVQLNPLGVSSWVDLGLACESRDDEVCADQAFQRALQLAPMTPRVWWYAANYYLRTERTEAALLHFRRLLQVGAEYAGPAFQLCLRATNDTQLLYERLLAGSENTRLKLSYADFLAARGYLDAAFRVWTQAVSDTSPFPFAWTETYLERLISLGRIREAARAWQDLERLGTVRRSRAEDPSNLVFNGGFEQTPLNAGFDWRLRQVPYLSLDFSDSAAYRGSRCLRVEFTVSRNEEYEPVLQIAPVVPTQHYLLTAFVRSEEITSDSGPRLRVLDLSSASRTEARTEATVGTTAWHSVSVRFSTGPRAQSVRVSVWRPRSRTFPGEISGRFWLDAVCIRPLNGAREKTTGCGLR